jgi:hypothetical protein
LTLSDVTGSGVARVGDAPATRWRAATAEEAVEEGREDQRAVVALEEVGHTLDATERDVVVVVVAQSDGNEDSNAGSTSSVAKEVG